VGKVEDEHKPCLFEVNQGKFISCPPGDGISPVAIYQDQSALWLGGREVRTVAGDNWVVTNWTATYPALREALCMCGDGTNVWIGTKRHGLARWTAKGLTLFTNGFGGERIMAVMNDADGIVWLATENGLTRLCNGRFFVFATDNGLPETTINSIVADDFGCLWLGGLHGIYRVERKQLNAVADGRQRTAQSLTFDGADGMESPETNGGETQPGGWKANDGRVWFATSHGVATIDTKEIEKTLTTLTNPPPTIIEQVKADNRVIFGDTIGGSGSVAQIAPGRGRVMEFRFTANSFIDSQRLQFRYRLADYETAWHEKTLERFIHYANLRPGQYKFEVMAINHHGVWSARTASFGFILLPHYWETWPFYAFCVVGAIGVAAGVQTYRLRWQHRLLKIEEQRTLANERARIARDLHDDLGTALTGLALELDVLGREPAEPPSIAGRLNKTAQRVRNLANRMREVVWTVNPDCDTVSSLASFIEQQVEQFLRLSHLRVRLEFPEDIPPLPLEADARYQLALGVREALTNVVRHANATEAVVSLEIAGHRLVLRVQDNGCGCQPTNTEGHGLKNLRTRLQGLGGSFECVSKPGEGTTVTFQLPLKTEEDRI
jgi:signal transduction histidine kinase